MEENNTGAQPPTNDGSSKTPWIVGAIVLLVLIGGYVAMQGNDDAMREVESRQENDPGQQAANQPGNQQQTPVATQGEVKSFTVEGSNFKFNPSEIRVKEGDTVKITFKNTGGFHDWVVDQFGAATKQANAPAEETIQFVANKKGTFEYYCSVGTHRQMGMKGNLIVE
jgi:plastocyanin